MDIVTFVKKFQRNKSPTTYAEALGELPDCDEKCINCEFRINENLDGDSEDYCYNEHRNIRESGWEGYPDPPYKWG